MSNKLQVSPALRAGIILSLLLVARSGSGYALAIPGTGSLSGTVGAPKPFKAAKVYANNESKNVLYMVYTRAGRYQALNLMPGSYEIWVEKRGFESDRRKLEIQAGATLKLDFNLKEKPDSSPMTLYYAGRSEGGIIDKATQLLPYEQLYPAGPGRVLIERTCMVCHLQNFLSTRQKSLEEWDAAIGMMMDPNNPQGARILEGNVVGTITPAERKTIAQYLATNFGPGSRPRALKITEEYPLDEEALSKAMYIEYPLPKGRQAHEPHLDSDGNAWYTDPLKPPRVGRLDPRTAEFKQYPLPDPTSRPEGLTVDSKGFVFWCEPEGGALGRLDPRTGKIDRFFHNIPGGHIHTPVVDANQDVWFSMILGNRVGKWDRKTEKISLWEIPTPNSFPYGIIAQNGLIWFAEFHGGKIGKFDPATERFTEYPALAQPTTIRRLSMDSHGATVWYALFNRGKLGKLDVKTGERKEYGVLSHTGPYDVWPDPDDKIWITDGALGGALIRFDPQTGKQTFYPSPRRSDFPKLDIGSDGSIWYATRSAAEVAIGVLHPDMTKMKSFAAYPAHP